MNKKTLRDIKDVRGRRVLVRVDFNVPLDPQTWTILDDSRLRASLPTINHLIRRGAKIILCSHLGSPKGVDERLRMTQVARRLASLLGMQVAEARDCIGPQAETAVSLMREGDVLLLENLRFHPEEEKNDPAFAQDLAKLADLFVNDAFGTAHRAHASTVGVARYIPAVAGFLMEKEVSIIGQALEAPARPFAAVIGGAKVSGKIGVVKNLLTKVDSLLVGGGMACTFLRAQGFEMGQSLVEEDYLNFAQTVMDAAGKELARLLLPQDLVVADRVAADAATEVVPVDSVPASGIVVDIGPKTIATFEDELRHCRTVVWNGPMGIFEYPAFRRGTHAVAAALAGLRGATTIVGGGSTAEAVEEMSYAGRMTHVSTGGGASLALMEGAELPGVAALLDREHANRIA